MLAAHICSHMLSVFSSAGPPHWTAQGTSAIQALINSCVFNTVTHTKQHPQHNTDTSRRTLLHWQDVYRAPASSRVHGGSKPQDTRPRRRDEMKSGVCKIGPSICKEPKDFVLGLDCLCLLPHNKHQPTHSAYCNSLQLRFRMLQ